jgi:hypothetical protein
VNNDETGEIEIADFELGLASDSSSSSFGSSSRGWLIPEWAGWCECEISTWSIDDEEGEDTAVVEGTGEGLDPSSSSSCCCCSFCWWSSSWSSLDVLSCFDKVGAVAAIVAVVLAPVEPPVHEDSFRFREGEIVGPAVVQRMAAGVEVEVDGERVEEGGGGGGRGGGRRERESVLTSWVTGGEEPVNCQIDYEKVWPE